MVTYRLYEPAIDRDSVRALALRGCDMVEVLDMSGERTIPDALEECLKLSSESYVILRDDAVVGIFGVSVSKSYAIPWLLGTKHMTTFSFCKKARQIVQEWAEDYPPMFNLVWSRNRTAIRFLKWLGFGFPDHEPIQVNNHLYLKFTYP